MAIKTQTEFYEVSDKIAYAMRNELSADAIHAIADAINLEYRLTFNERFRKIAFLERAGLV